MAETENTRLLALEVLVEVEKQNIFAKDALHKLLYQKQFLSKQDRAFITRLVEGTTEYQTRLDYVINLYSKTKVNKCKPLIRCVLRMGVYQMLYMDSVPNGVACNESVKLAKKKGFHNLTGFVNGVLRSVERNIDSIPYPKREDGLAVYLSVQYSIPQWLVERFLQWYEEEQVIQILEASLQATGITIRVNDNKISRQELAAKLEEQGMDVEDGYYSEDALHVSKINYVSRIPGFRQGEFFIQDESSMLLYPIANIEAERKDGQVLHILDLCAAPGGKCTHFAQKLGDTAYIEARDVSERKTALIEENRERLGLSNMEEKVWDALILDESKKEWADLVIADLPCSGFGILSHKNDIKYHISEQQLLELSNLQKTILTNAVSYVKPGGILVFSTCTINPEENRDNVQWALSHLPLEKEPIEELVPENLRSFVDEEMLQLLPGACKCDGFFIAKFRRKVE